MLSYRTITTTKKKKKKNKKEISIATFRDRNRTFDGDKVAFKIKKNEKNQETAQIIAVIEESTKKPIGQFRKNETKNQYEFVTMLDLFVVNVEQAKVDDYLGERAVLDLCNVRWPACDINPSINFKSLQFKVLNETKTTKTTKTKTKTTTTKKKIKVLKKEK